MNDFPNPVDTVILGAGAAGLSAAVTLAAAGREPVILEAAKQPGGRARSFMDDRFGTHLDNGPHLLVGAYHQTLALLERLGTRRHLAAPGKGRYDFWDPERGWTRLETRCWPAPWHLAAALFRSSLLPWRDRLALARLAPALLSLEKNRPALDHRSVTQWLLAQGQTPGLLQRFWTPLCLATLNEPPASASAAPFARVIEEMFLRGGQAAQPLIPRLPLSQLLAEPARAFIEARGGRLLCRRRVRKIVTDAQRITALHIDAGGHDPMRILQPRTLIAALPHRTLAALLPHWAEQRGFARLQPAPIVSVHLAYDTPLRLPVAMLGLPFASSQWLFDHGHLSGSKTGHISAVISGAYRECHWPPEKLAATVHADLCRVQPARAAHRPRASRVIKEHRATFAPWPGSGRQRPGADTPWNNFWLAGDWTDTGLPATLEGAVRSGIRAARKVLDFSAADD